MANGEICIHCGHQEVDHDSYAELPWEVATEKLSGFKYPPNSCPGFESVESIYRKKLRLNGYPHTVQKRTTIKHSRL